MPTVNELFVRAFDDCGSAYYERAASLVDPVADLVVDRAGIGRGASVADLGCGPATVFRALHRAGLRHFDGSGFDLSERQLQLGRKAMTALNLRPRLVRGDAQSVDLGDASADAVTASLCLPYLDDPLRCLREAARIAVAGAPVVVTTFGHPLLGGAGDRLLRAMDRVGVPTLPMHLAHTPEELAQWAFRADLDEVVIEEHDIHLRFDDADAWLAAARSLGLMIRLTQAPPEAAAALRDEVAADDRVVGPTAEVSLLVRILLLRARAA